MKLWIHPDTKKTICRTGKHHIDHARGSHASVKISVEAVGAARLRIG